MKKLTTVLFSMFIVNQASAGAIDSYYSNLSVATDGPSSYQTQSAGGVSAGGLAIRSRSVTLQPFAAVAPSFSSSCGNMNMFLGSFSYLSNPDQLMQFLQGMITAMAPALFQIALNAMSPGLGDVVRQFFDEAVKLMSLAMNSCQLGQSAGGALGRGLGQYVNSATQGSGTGAMLAQTATVGLNAVKDSAKSAAGALSDAYANLNSYASGDVFDQMVKGNQAQVNKAMDSGMVIWKSLQQSHFANSAAFSGSGNDAKDLANMIISLTGDVMLYGDPTFKFKAVSVDPAISQGIGAFFDPKNIGMINGSFSLYDCSGWDNKTPKDCTGNSEDTYQKVTTKTLPKTAPLTGDNIPLYRVNTSIKNISAVAKGTSAASSLTSFDFLVMNSTPIAVFDLAQTMTDLGIDPAPVLQNRAPQITFYIISRLLNETLANAQQSLANLTANDEADEQQLITARNLLSTKIKTLTEELNNYSKIYYIDTFNEQMQLEQLKRVLVNRYSSPLVDKINFAKQMGVQ
jgi:hypothetical protein